MSADCPSCLLCAAPDCRRVTTVPPGYRVWHCSCCEFEWIDREDLQNTDSSTLYQDYPYNARIHSSFARMRAIYLLGFQERVLRYYAVEDLGRLEFLDIGCANGEYLMTALDLGLARVAGVEIDHTAANHARQFGDIVDNVRWLDGQFDIVQIKNVITNIQDFAGFLDDCLLCLKSNGMLFLDVVNQYSLTALARKARHLLGSKASRYGRLRPPFVINGFSRASVVFLLKQRSLYPLSVRMSYLGSREVPYADVPLVKWAGMVGKALGMGTMTLVDARKAGGD